MMMVGCIDSQHGNLVTGTGQAQGYVVHRDGATIVRRKRNAGTDLKDTHSTGKGTAGGGARQGLRITLGSEEELLQHGR